MTDPPAPRGPGLPEAPDASAALGDARLCLISDRRLMGASVTLGLADLARFGDVLARALDGAEPGTAWVQVREKDLDGRQLAALVRGAIAVARPRGVRVLVNDRLDIALATGADGVHLPEDGLDLAAALGPLTAPSAATPAPPRAHRLVVGCSRHAVDAALAAAEAGADLVQVGPIFATPSKAAFGPPLGPAALTAARAALDQLAVQAAGVHPGRRVRLVAVGGIDSPERARQARAAGAAAIAVIRAVWTAADPAAVVRALASA